MQKIVSLKENVLLKRLAPGVYVVKRVTGGVIDTKKVIIR